MGWTTRMHHMADEVASVLAASKRVLFITGAGLSADSGLPTYRGLGGLYEDQDADGLPVEVALSGAMLREDPSIAWKHIAQVEAACRGATYNRGHEVIARLERRLERVLVLTQNVDGLHRKAGSQRVVDIHGDLHSLRCTQCDYRHRVTTYDGLALPPECPVCGAPIRPDVVLFGEMLPMPKLATLQEEVAHGFDLVFSVGTSSLFPYISEPVVAAQRLGVPTVEINPEETTVSAVVKYRIPSGAAAALGAIWDRFVERLPN